MAYKKDGQDLDALVCQIADTSLPHASFSSHTQTFIKTVPSPEAITVTNRNGCSVISIPISEFEVSPQEITSVIIKNVLNAELCTNNTDVGDPGWIFDGSYLTIYFNCAPSAIGQLGNFVVAYTRDNYHYGNTGISRFLAYEMPFTQHIDGYKVNGETVPLVKRGFGPYLENGLGKWKGGWKYYQGYRIGSDSDLGSNGKKIDIRLFKSGTSLYADVVERIPAAGSASSLYLLPISIPHLHPYTRTELSNNAPDLIYFELCAAGGSSGGANGYKSSGGGGGGASACGLLDFSKGGPFWISIGHNTSGGSADGEYAGNGSQGIASIIVQPNLLSMNINDSEEYEWSGIVLHGGKGGTGSSGLGTEGSPGAGGSLYNVVGISKYVGFSDLSTVTTDYNMTLSDASTLGYIDCSDLSYDFDDYGSLQALIVKYSGSNTGIYILGCTPGGSGGAVDSVGENASMTADFCSSYAAAKKVCSGTGGSNEVDGESAYGGGGGASALGNGGSGARYTQTPVNPGYGGGGGGKGYYWGGGGQAGSSGGPGLLNIYWNDPSTFYQTPLEPEITCYWDYWIDPNTGLEDTGRTEHKWTVYNTTDTSLEITVFWDEGTITEYESYSKTQTVGANSSYTYTFYAGTNTIDWGVRAYAVATLNGFEATSDTVIYNSSKWDPTSSTATTS